MLQRIRHLVSLRLALLNFSWVVFQWAVIPGCRWSPRCPLSPFPLRVGFLVGTCFRSCLCFFGIFLFWPVFSHRRSRFSLLDCLGCPHPLRFFFVLANNSLPFVLRHLGRYGLLSWSSPSLVHWRSFIPFGNSPLDWSWPLEFVFAFFRSRCTI